MIATSQNPSVYVTVSTLLTRLGLKKRGIIDEAIRRGDLVAVNLSQGKKRPTWRISESAIQAFLESRQAVPTSTTPTKRTARRKSAGVTKYF